MFDYNDSLGLPEEMERPEQHIIKVIGVGGGGCNVVRAIHDRGIEGIKLMVCNTDAQAISESPIPERIILGAKLSYQAEVGSGLGAGCDPQRGKAAAESSIEEIKNSIDSSTKMVFVTACLGGGTGTGAAPVVAKVAKELGKLTVGVVTIPTRDEGDASMTRAIKGLKELRPYVDSLLIVDNQKIYKVFSDFMVTDGFAKVNEVLVTAVKSISEFITRSGTVNVDFADVRMVMKDGGMAIMGIGEGEGSDRVVDAVNMAFDSPLLNDCRLETSKGALVSICSSDLTMSELNQITETVQSYTGNPKKFKRGITIDHSMGDKVRVTIVATGFELENLPGIPEDPDRKVVKIEDPNADGPQIGAMRVYKESEANVELEKDAPYVRSFGDNETPALVVDSDAEIIKLESEPAYVRRARRYKS